MSRIGIDSKFARARRLIAELHGEVEAFLASGAYRVEQTEEPNGDLVYRARVDAQPPVEWSVLIGDIVHNARSALDHLAYALVAQNNGAPDEHTYFPITDQATGFGARLRSSLRGASPAAKDAVRALQPWRGGDDQLWQLHRLDILDKHRLLVPVGASHAHTLWGLTAQLPGTDTKERISIPLNPTDRQYPLEDGAEVFRIMKAGRDTEDSPIKSDHSIVVEMAFGEGQIVVGEPLLPALTYLVDHAASVIEPLVAGL